MEAPTARLVGTASLATSFSLASPALHRVGDAPTAPFPDALSSLALGALVLLSGWLGIVLWLDAGGRRSRRIARRLTPSWAQGLLLASVGLAATVAPAHADPGALDGLSLPDRSVVTPARSDPAPSHPVSSPPALSHRALPSAAAASITVRPGDTLWGIAARHLPPDTSPARVAAAVRDWHEQNRSTIGPDPDRILVGQVLALPPGSAS